MALGRRRRTGSVGRVQDSSSLAEVKADAWMADQIWVDFDRRNVISVLGGMCLDVNLTILADNSFVRWRKLGCKGRLPVSLSACRFIWRSGQLSHSLAIYQSIYQSIYLYLCRIYQSNYRLSLSVSRSVSNGLVFVRLSDGLSVILSVYLLVSLSACRYISACLPASLFACLYRYVPVCLHISVHRLVTAR